MRTQGGGSHLPAKERGRNQTCRHLDLGLPASSMLSKYISYLRPQVCGVGSRSSDMLVQPHQRAGASAAIVRPGRCCSRGAHLGNSIRMPLKQVWAG